MQPPTRERLRELFLQALHDLDLGDRMRAHISLQGTTLDICGHGYALDRYSDLRVIAFGKAAPQMATTLDDLLGTGRAGGLVASSTPAPENRSNFEYLLCGHPYPNQASLEAAASALRLLSGASNHTLAIFLVSGGGSATLEQPLFDDITLDDLVAFHQLLVTRGASIYEMNVLRKHFSAVKGGRLAVAARPAQQATIFVSDVPVDKPSAVASGPTIPDESTVAECIEVAARYGLLPLLPEPYRHRIETGAIPETPKPGDVLFANSRYCSVLSNVDGVEALLRLARAHGWEAEADLSCDDWQLETAADYLLAKLRAKKRASPTRTVCLVSGGELSSPVTGPGVGGRNQAFVLNCALKIEGEPIAMLSAGTDGIDGNSPAAGAVADGSTVARARALGLDVSQILRESDSYRLSAALGDAIITGPTGNNVRDLRIMVM